MTNKMVPAASLDRADVRRLLAYLDSAIKEALQPYLFNLHFEPDFEPDYFNITRDVQNMPIP